MFSVVVNHAEAETVLFGPEGVPRNLAQRLEAIGPHYLDAPISGGAARANRRELTVLASGSDAAFGLARPPLALFLQASTNSARRPDPAQGSR